MGLTHVMRTQVNYVMRKQIHVHSKFHVQLMQIAIIRMPAMG